MDGHQHSGAARRKATFCHYAEEIDFRRIYKLDGDMLYWCVSNPRKDRPSEFRAKGGQGQFLLVLTRKKK